jgi:hypothetical protein
VDPCTVTVDAPVEVTASFGIAGEHLWSAGYGSSGSDTGSAIAFDTAGNIIIAGTISGTANFGGDDLVNTDSATDPNDIFVVKLSPAGTHIWSRRFDCSGGGDVVGDVATDLLDNVLVIGTFADTCSFEATRSSNANSSDIYLVKLSATDGSFLWSQAFGGTTHDHGQGVAIAAGDEIVITGDISGTTSFGGAPHTPSSYDGFVARYDPDGGFVRSYTIGGPTGFDSANDVAIDSKGDVIIAGGFGDGVDFGSGTIENTTSGSEDAFVAKYSSTGVYRWHVTFESALGRTANAVAVGATGDVVVGGLFFAAAISPAGAVRWDKNFATSGDGSANSVGIDSAGSVIVGGNVRTDMSFGGPTLASFGEADAFLVKYSPAGSHLWSKRFGSGGNDAIADAKVDGPGRIVVTGPFYGVGVSFGGPLLDSVGDRDVFAARYGP